MSTEVDAGSDDLDPFDDQGLRDGKDQDGVRSLRDLQEESGDEDEVDDIFAMDRREAGQAGVDLDRSGGSESSLT